MNILKRLLTATLCTGILLSLGCATSKQKQFVDGFTDRGVPTVNSVVTRTTIQGLQISTYGRLIGSPPADHDDDHQLIHSLVASDRLTLNLISPGPITADVTNSLNLDDPDTAMFVDTLARTVDFAIQAMPELMTHDVEVDLAFAPLESGHSIRRTTLITDQPLRFGFIFSTPGDHFDSTAHYWGTVVDTVSHELLHVEQGIAGHKESLLDREVAAALFGNCTMFRFAIALGAEQATMDTTDLTSLPQVDDIFPGLVERGDFSPQLSELEYWPHESARSRVIALAILHLHSDHGVIRIGDEAAVRDILDLCETLGDATPRFSEGELPARHVR